MTKTCGECKHFDRKLGICDLTDDFSTVMSNTPACVDFEICLKPTNGDKIIAGGNKALVKFHLLGTCDTCTYYNKEHTSHNDICLCPKDKTCADGIEAWLNAPAESEWNNENNN